MPLLIRWLINAGALMFVEWWVDGIHLSGFGAALLAAALIGVLNVVLKPILLLLTLPLNILTLGLFTFVINALILLLVSSSNPQAWFYVSGFKAAFLGALLLSLVSWLVNYFLSPGEQGRTVFWARYERSGQRYQPHDRPPSGPPPHPDPERAERTEEIDDDTIDLHQDSSGRWKQ